MSKAHRRKPGLQRLACTKQHMGLYLLADAFESRIKTGATGPSHKSEPLQTGCGGRGRTGPKQKAVQNMEAKTVMNKEVSKNKELSSNKASHSGEPKQQNGSRDGAKSSTDCRRMVAVEGVGSARGGGGGEGGGKEGRKRQKRKVEESSFARSVRQSALKFGNNEEAALNIAIRLSQQDVSVSRSMKEEEEDPWKRTPAQTERQRETSGDRRRGRREKE